MPTLKLFKRTWKVAEDDLVIVGIFNSITRFLLVLAAIVLLIIQRSLLDHVNQGIFFTTCVISCVHIIIFSVIAKVSSRGGIMEISKRKCLGSWVLAHFLFFIIEIIFTCLSIWRIVSLRFRDTKPNTDIHTAVICWCSIVLIFDVFACIWWILHYDRNGAIKYQVYQTFFYGENENMTDEEKRDLIRSFRAIPGNKWTKLMRKILPSDFESENEMDEAINETSSILADYFTDYDMTHSDISAGLFLLRWQTAQWLGGQGKVRSQFVLEQTNPSTADVAASLLIFPDDPFKSLENNWLHISRLRQYAHFVKASYGWFSYYTQNICSCTAIHRLCEKLSFENEAASDKQYDIEMGINGPGGCLCSGRNAYLAAFMEMTGLIADEILVFEISDKLYEVSLMLVIDDSTQAIVLIVRGTNSGDDTVVDILAVGEPLRDEDYDLPEAERYIAHGGMARAARSIAKRLIKERWIERARERRPNYPLVVCGHSLGAGISSLLSILLKPHFPEVKAYAFSPPGGLMNLKCAETTWDNVVSIIYGFDGIGRLSGPTMEDFKARLLHALTVCRTPKWTFLSSRLTLTFLHYFCPCFRFHRIGDLDTSLDEDVRAKLIDPDLEDVYCTEFGSNLKKNRGEVIGGVSYVDRLLESNRSLMNWKKPEANILLRFPRPYPKHLYPQEILDGTLPTFDIIINSIKNPCCGKRILHILEVDSEFKVPGVQPYNKRNYIPPPIFLWRTDSSAFKSILFHPKMVSNHSIMCVSSAIDRLYASITWPDCIFPKVPISTYRREFKPLRGTCRAVEELSDTYCRVRVMR